MYGRYCGGEGVLWRRVVQGGARADAAIDRGGPTSVPLANWRPPALPHYTATLPQWRPHLPPLFPLVIMSHLCCGMSHASRGAARISRAYRSTGEDSASPVPGTTVGHAPLCLLHAASPSFPTLVTRESQFASHSSHVLPLVGTYTGPILSFLLKRRMPNSNQFNLLFFLNPEK